MSVIANNIVAGAAGQGGAAAYQIDRSLRFNSADSSHLTFQPSSAGNRKTWTWSGWLKRYSTGIRQIFFSCWTGSTRLNFGYLEDDRFEMGTQFAYILKSNALFRDPAAWQHWVVSVDTTLSSNRCKVYLNGSEITSWNTNSFDSTFAQNADTDINQAAVHYIGQLGTGTSYLNAGLADVHFIDGQALAASDFGEFDSNNVWQPKEYSGSYGTNNGFHLDFSNSSDLGNDAAGSNNWTPNNFSVASGAGNDSLIDTPTNYTASPNNGGNYATMNPVGRTKTQYFTENGNLTCGNSDVPSGSSGSRGFIPSTIGFKSGKWYSEVQTTAASDGDVDFAIGIYPADSTGYYSNSGHYAIRPTGHIYSPAGVHQSYGTTWTDSDIIGIVVDMDSSPKTIQFFKNGVAVASATTIADKEYFFGYGSDGGGSSRTYKATWNFGASGSFAYTPPTGHKSLCTQNLTDPTIADGSTAMDVALYTGNGTNTNTISGLSMSPDLVWLKRRDSASHHALYDAVRGAYKHIGSSHTSAEYTESTGRGLSAFNSDGFTIDTSNGEHVGNGSVNVNNATYSGWAWDAGSSTATSTDGDIQASVRANQSAGFSIVKFTAGGSYGMRSIGHGLNDKPLLVISKRTDSTGDWLVHTEATGSVLQMELNKTDAAVAGGSYYSANSSTFSLYHGHFMDNGFEFINYCFAPVAGYSAFGSFTSGSDPFVYTGFKPKFVLLKRSNAAAHWYMFDSDRGSINANETWLEANGSGAEQTHGNGAIDFLSNGFRPIGGDIDPSGGTFIYAAFAEHPFKTARAR